MVNPGTLESVLLTMLMLMEQPKLEAEPGLLGEVEILLLRADDNTSGSSAAPSAKIRFSSRHTVSR